MKWSSLSRSRNSRWKFRPRVRGLCQACGTTTDVVNPNGNKKYIDTKEINHKEIRKNALKLMENGEISKEEYIMVVDADLKYEAGLEVSDVKITLETKNTPESRPKLSSRYSLSPSPSVLERAASLYPMPTGNVDPITLDELGNNIFTFITPHGHDIKYNIESLVQYIDSSGDFRDPVSRYPFSSDDIMNIDQKINDNEDLTHLPSLKNIRENSHQYCVQKQKKEECQNLEACLGELVVEMLDIIESPSMGPRTTEVAEMRMYALLSEFDAPFKLLKSIDIEQARQSLLTWLVFLRGPAKRPTKVKGPRGSLKSAVNFLEGQWTPSDEMKLKTFHAKFEN